MSQSDKQKQQKQKNKQTNKNIQINNGLDLQEKNHPHFYDLHKYVIFTDH